jgi:hypothetical protein
LTPSATLFTSFHGFSAVVTGGDRGLATALLPGEDLAAAVADR